MADNIKIGWLKVYCSVSWVLHEGLRLWCLFGWWNFSKKEKKKDKKWGARSNSKPYESEESTRNYVRRKIREKRREKTFMEEVKKSSSKSNYTPNNSSPASYRTSSLNSSTAMIVVATQTFNDDKATSNFFG